MKKACACFLLFALVSCGQKTGFDPSVFPFTDDADLGYLTRNGDNYTKSGLSYSYDEVLRELDYDAFEKQLEHEESFLIYLHQDGCHTCQSVHDDMVSYWLDSGVMTYGIHIQQGNVQASVSLLNSFGVNYPELSDVFSGQYFTPTLFYVRNESKALKIPFTSERDSLSQLEDYLRGLFNYTNVYRFTSYQNYAKFAAEMDCISFCGDDVAYFYDELYPLAKHSKKNTALLETSFFSEEDLSALRRDLEGKDLWLNSAGKRSNPLSSKENALESRALIESYYV